MKTVLAAVASLLLLPVGASHAQTALPAVLKLPDGRALAHPILGRYDGQVFSIEHDGGIAKVPWEMMPEPYRAGYSFDPDRARDERRKALAQTLNVRPIKEVETDMPAFVGKRFTFQGTVELATLYTYAYRDAQTTHYAFTIKDASGGTCHAYMAKTDPRAEALRATLLSGNKGKQEPQTFVCTILPGRFSKGQWGIMAELIAYGQDVGLASAAR